MSGTGHSTTRSMGVPLLWLSGIAAVLAAAIAATGGFSLELGFLRLSMHAVMRPVVASLAFGIVGALALGRDRTELQLTNLLPALLRDGWLIAGAFAVAIGAGTFAGGAQIAGGTDSSGYLSEARLWRAAGFWNVGALRSTTPLARELTLTNRQYPFTPAGYQPAGDGVIVPQYPPGLPLHFALAGAIGGERAQFMVVPLSAAGIVIVAFLIGRKIAGGEAALFAAAAGGASPILIYQATQPMSDVVAAFWWSLAVLLLIETGAAGAAGAGVAAAIACGVRPNLFAMVPILGVLAGWWRGWSLRALATLSAFAAPAAIAALAFALLQRFLYGNESTTGYGEVSSLFAVTNVWPNLVRYPRWAIFTQSALLFAAVAAPIAIRRGWVTPAIDRAVAARVAWSGLVFFACLQAFYLLYTWFDDWVYFRFLLPALPWVLALQATAIAAACRRVPSQMQGVAVLVVAVLLGSWGVGRARLLGAFRLQDSEQRYLDVARFSRGLPPNAVFISLQHSGSLSYYNGAAVLRWDWLEPGEIDRAVSELSLKGRAIFAVFDDWELRQFRDRFAGTRTAATIGTPAFTAGGPPGIATFLFTISGTTVGGSGAPVSLRPPLVTRIPRRPGAPVP